jgi:ketosteroid isomerase-like protein
MSATETLERMLQAINSHDINAMVSCFADDYRCEIPLHPSRSFVGNDHVRQNWTGLFRRVPDIQARVLRSVEDGDSLWSEWELIGTTTDGSDFRTGGVAILGVENGRFAWSRFYLEPVDDQPIAPK